MTAPFAKSGVLPMHGIAPFTFSEPAVAQPPVEHFVRSLWAYDYEDADTFEKITQSMRRVGTINSGIEGGDTPIPTLPLPLPILQAGASEPRASRLSTRFFFLEDFFEDVQPTLNGVAAYPDYTETHFIAIVAQVPNVVTAKSWNLLTTADGVSKDGLYLPLPQCGDLDYRVREIGSNEDITEDVPGGWVLDFSVTGTGIMLGAIPNKVTGDPVVPAIFIGDGSDGNPPQLLADGRTPQQQLAYVNDSKNAANLFLGFSFGTAAERQDLLLLTASIAHSVAMVNG